tara:strand:- start:3374 stop:3622 length:249 start_codon:yes stop_codon:yes gene_type:complete
MMQFDSFSAFLNMGGYGFYVWLSFGISTVLILALIFNSILGHKQVIKNIAIRQQKDCGLRQLRKQRNQHNDSNTNTTKEVTQ